MSEEIIEAQRKRYQARFYEYGDEPEELPKKLFWNNRQTQFLRFERLMRELMPLGKEFSIHDVGCGFSDLHQYLVDCHIPHTYSGTEIVAETIETARGRFPGLEIFERDFATVAEIERYDIVVLSGTLNLRGAVSEGGWRAYCYKLLKRMYQQADKAIAFNFLTSYSTFTAPELCYFDPREMFDFCQRELSRFVVVDNSYPLYEVTFSVFKPEYLKTQYQGPEYQKYFRAQGSQAND